MVRHIHIIFLLISLAGVDLHAQQVDEVLPGEAVERHLPMDAPATQWAIDPEVIDSVAGDRIETREILAEEIETIKLTGLVPPVRFESGVADISESYIEQLRAILADMRHLRNVRLHLVGHADDQQLSSSLAQVYGNNAGLSRERAGQVAEFIQNALILPPDAISFEWAGDTRPVASNDTLAGRAQNRRVEVEVWYDELKPTSALEEFVVAEEIRRVKVCRMETVCKLRYQEGHKRRARVRNLVPPLRYEEANIDIDKNFIGQIRQSLANLADKQNVTVKFIGHTDDVVLTGRAARLYGDHLSLSRARAHRVALDIAEKLDLHTAAVASDGRGADQPLASNDKPQGRALNRRIEVEFWHDDPLQELPDEPQLCPGDAGAELVTRIYDPPWGAIETVEIIAGEPAMPTGLTGDIRRALDDVADKTNPRVRFVGYTRNEGLDRRTAIVYGDDIGLSAARARRTMESAQETLGLADTQVEHLGRGYVHSNDVVNAGFVQGDTSHVMVQVVYDELAVLDDYEGVDVTPLTRELNASNPLGLNLMRITVDGDPVDDPGRSSADIQRCTDVALENADIRFRFDNLVSERRLSVSAAPTAVRFGRSPEARMIGEPVAFQMYSNYSAYIDRAEVRVFNNNDSVQAEPVAVLPIDNHGVASWQPKARRFRAPAHELKYVLRAYGAKDRFDETTPQSLWMIFSEESLPDSVNVVEVEADENTGSAFDQVLDRLVDDVALVDPDEGFDEQVLQRPADDSLLAGYGSSEIAVRNIGLGSGTVNITGSGIPSGHRVWLAGTPVPVDAKGSFVAETILPSGMHTVEVAVLDEDGNGELFLRDLEFKDDDWFYVGVADLTLSVNESNGAVDELEGRNAPNNYDPESDADGRLAFYVNGKFSDDWRLTASADTEEGPLDDLFSNFMDKSPESLFRRIDPDYHYPTFGDDGVVDEAAPTSGKFYVKLSERENHALWGNFRVDYTDNELARINRGLYGSNLHVESDGTTSFGERRYAVDGFAAEPGTVGSREEFRGTGGSLYFLGRQDILAGSERLSIETRDKDTGIVMGVVHLRPVLDYDIDYLQGRVLLSEPLSSTVDDSLLVRSGGLSGDEVWLVTNYEYTPGFDDIETLSTGGQGHVWLNDAVRVGATASSDDDDETSNSSLVAKDLTLRKSSDTWLKFQTGRSEGQVSSTQRSVDGGFEFAGAPPTLLDNADAESYRTDLSLGFSDLFESADGSLNLYVQDLGAGYSAPGQTTFTDLKQYGGNLELPLTERIYVGAKGDISDQDQALKTTTGEVNFGYDVTDRISVNSGVRYEDREDRSLLVPTTQEEGERTDAVVQFSYDTHDRWRSYGFVQDTLSKDDGREDNGRYGAGMSYRWGDRLVLDSEVSDGDLGTAASIGSNYLVSDATSLYLNYSLENERTDNGLRQQRGNLVTGASTRFSDSTSVFHEERYERGDAQTGLTHATGVNLVPNDRWNMGLSTEIGTLDNRQTGSEIKRRAGGLRVGYGFDTMQLSSAVEYRYDDSEALNGAWSERTTWLFRNSFKYQIGPDWRMVGKFNHADSDSSDGDYFDGGYTEAVLGYALRPVTHDRLNVLAKYTYFYNMPTTEQETGQNVVSEFIQKSHVAAVDVTYDLTNSWSIGGKYAYRLGQVSLNRESEDFFDNDAHLYVARADWRFRHNWEGLIEGRVLDMPDIEERRTGTLVTLYRYLGDHLKIGVGYSFADFSDDLTDLDYDQRGVFMNIVGAM